MKKLLLLLPLFLLSACTGISGAQIADNMFMHYKDFARVSEPGDATVIVESTNTQKFFRHFSDVYLDVYQGCTTGPAKQGYLGAIHVSSNPEVGLVKEAKLPSGKELFLSLGQYHAMVSCGGNLVITLDKDKVYKFLYQSTSGRTCSVQVLEKTQADADYTDSKSVRWGWDGGSGLSYRKVDWRNCRDWNQESKDVQ